MFDPNDQLYFKFFAEKWEHEQARNALCIFIREKGLTEEAINWVEEKEKELDVVGEK